MFDLNRALGPLEKASHFPFGVWDIEASDWWNLELIGAFDGHDYYHFRDIGDFLNHIMQRKYRNFRWFAHFGGRYDLNFVFDYIRNRNDVSVSFYCSGSMVVQMTIKRAGIITKLCDSYRLLPVALGDKMNADGKVTPGLTTIFDVKHKKQIYDFTAMSYGRELIEYNEYDCKGLWECLQVFFDQTGMQSETFATHTMKIFRKDFLKRNIWKPRPEVLNFVRPAYHGGRVEVYKSKHPNLNAYDVNSMYPYVMQFPMPVDYIGESKKLLDSHYGFVKATVVTPDIYMPMLPVRIGKLYFPVGEMTATWTSEELIEAEKRGVKIQKIHEAHYFQTEEIFREYVLKLYALKESATDLSTRTITKLLMNSLYGKFGQTPEKRVYCTLDVAPHGSYPVLDDTGMPTGYAYYEKTSNAAYLLPHLAATVTSKARLHLLTQLTDATFYCDTDSVFTTQTIQTSTKLGAWGIVGSGECEFHQPKLYRFKGVWKAKGLNRDANIDEFISGAPNIGKRTISIKEAMNRNVPAKQHLEVSKVLREDNPKRSWDAKHEDTRPWNIVEISGGSKVK